MTGIRVERPGFLTTVQDAGRFGFQRYGVSVGGAMDAHSLRIANLLVGNEEGEAGLEITLAGPTLTFESEAWIALCGGDFSPRIGDQPVPQWRPVRVQNGVTLKLAAAAPGCRAYLAVRGGFDLPPVLGSRSTTMRFRLGGLEGCALRAGDRLPLRMPLNTLPSWLEALAPDVSAPFAALEWSAGESIRTACHKNPTIRVMPGGEWERFTPDSRDRFRSQSFQITPHADRMGYRLAGPPLQLEQPMELLSEAVAFGTIQVTPQGDPIVLMADRPTTGGYPKIAQVATVDLPLLAQAQPGEAVRFDLITLQTAQALLREREARMEEFKRGLELYGTR